MFTDLVGNRTVPKPLPRFHNTGGKPFDCVWVWASSAIRVAPDASAKDKRLCQRTACGIWASSAVGSRKTNAIVEPSSSSSWQLAARLRPSELRAFFEKAGPVAVAEVRGVVLAAQFQFAVGRKRQSDHKHQVGGDDHHVVPAEAFRQPRLDDTPDFSYGAWAGMLFSSGIGISLLYFGASEPLDHYFNPPEGAAASNGAARQALQLTFLHWGLHGWAIYALVGLAVAYFAYRHNQPLALRSALYPLVGERWVKGAAGHAVDGFGMFVTLLGLVTNLGIGAMQVSLLEALYMESSEGSSPGS